MSREEQSTTERSTTLDAELSPANADSRSVSERDVASRLESEVVAEEVEERSRELVERSVDLVESNPADSRERPEDMLERLEDVSERLRDAAERRLASFVSKPVLIRERR